MPITPKQSWRKSSRCTADANCVEIADSAPGALAVRDTKTGPDGPVLRFSRDEFATLFTRIKTGGLDLH
ncbi:DUF397 domain-containing protein [Actinomadura sp. KC345]|uniref:DUF397 domain-containing protein n=1 Tax=Actinomadura sp. KC345 TaxID=2530371 RepID=UPI00105268E7|nr:DUF397 domain-containing protein [Actinomadura sp. KC345]TDC51283.1 DUF397 domain-containing protein [Actinomadura sp. KC345]